MPDFLADLPIADIQIGTRQHLRIYGYADIEPQLVELRLSRQGEDEVIRLTVAQSREIAAALTAAADSASGGR